ncbi:MAG: uncharacterized protein PWQ58_252 [Archaeoglobaceae archaeon]|nr:uncharacterized protein [Archaeoglobaceae archaeon]
MRLNQVEGDKRFLENIKAYASDSEFFIMKSDFIRAFECVIWAWAWLEIGLELGKLYEAGPAHAGEQKDLGKNHQLC